MSILIKGMEMPKSCSECRFCAWKDENDVGCAATGKGADDCPIIPIPDHGDLIERDALMAEAEYVGTAQFIHPATKMPCGINLVEWLKLAPIVIPAERSEG